MKFRFFVLLLILPVLLQAQHIQYSEPEQDDSRRTNFEIIGKISGNILIFKNNHNNNALSVYNGDMKLQQRVPLNFLPERYTNIEFVQYPEFCYMLYEYEKKGIVHFSAVKIDGAGRLMSDPVDLDTTQVGSLNNNKIYTVAVSENKQNLMILKINSKNPHLFVFTSFLFNQNLELQDRHRINMDLSDRNTQFSNFALDDEGQLVFTRFITSNGEYVSKAALVMKAARADTFAIRDLGAGDRVLDELLLKIDNPNRRYLVSAFYYKQRRGNIEGLYTVIWDKETDSRFKESLTIFNDELRALAKSSESNLKMAFNDFFLKHIIAKRDGGYLVVSESNYTTTRGSAFNRWDYMYGSPYMDYSSPFYNPYSPWNRYGTMGNINRYNSENIMVLSFDKNSNLEWSNVIPKTQFDDEGNTTISHQMLITGGALHFLYNQYERRTVLLTDQSISRDGKLTHYPTLHNLDKGYEFMPRYGKQVTANSTIIPCQYKAYLCFAKIDF
ncbi:MAG TPA: hypothetical protein VG890_00530 [Puia sp.]|nr:hypothetical protein [Puia sp.]